MRFTLHLLAIIELIHDKLILLTLQSSYLQKKSNLHVNLITTML
jgi:hypothetical protein